MRLRKKDWSSEMFELHKDICIEDYEAIKGKWKQTLGVDKLRVEIGAGKGNYWHGLGKLYPTEGVVAMERDFTASSIALRKLADQPEGIKRFIYGDAARLDEVFADGEVDVIHLNFSDPWPKLRHEKRRLTHADKLKQYRSVLSDHGEIWMKTDNERLFEYSLVSVASHGFDLIEVSVNFRRELNNDPFTEYEEKFIGRGQPIFRAVWRKTDAK